MKIAVTGASGFIGRHFVPFLQGYGHEVIPISSDTYNLLDYDETCFALHDAEWVVHLAADMGGVGYFTNHDYQPFINNMQMDLNILDVCERLKVKRLLYAASACVYPIYYQQTDEVRILREEMINDPAQPDQMYGWEKLMGLKLCQRAPFDARVAILNTVYGPDCDITSERMKAPAAIATKTLAAKETGKLIQIWGNGKQVRQFLYIDDACEMLYRILSDQDYSGSVNVTHPHQNRILKYYDLCTNILGFDAEFELQEDKPSGVQTRVCSSDEFMGRYGYMPKVDAKEGFTKLLEWIQKTNH